MKITELSQNCGEWLRGGKNDHAGVVLSCRVRLARNLSAFNFVARADDAGRLAVLKTVREAVATINFPATELAYFDLEQLSDLERVFLLERHLISRELTDKPGARGVIFDRQEKLSLMINEEDHLRLQALGGGEQLRETYDFLSKIDDDLSNFLDFAWTPDLGYLTACPSNVGTGMRVSAMLHLPALTITKHIEKVFRLVTELHLAVRGYYGEGTKADGDLFQVSNQITLGRQESELIDDLAAMINQLTDFELKARDFLWQERRLELEDRVWRSWAVLREARLIKAEEAMFHLSSLRLGAAMRIIPPISPAALNCWLLLCQPAHLQVNAGRAEMPAPERDALRASMLRKQLNAIKN
ncbi:MAG: protein arginine kinase [Planctomycetota bacterium]|jgi:protein arginine kinase|nr:protein arginine kinase [Planctomycetota bacterium]